MKIKQTIEVEIIKKDDMIICDDIHTLSLIYGSKAISSNSKYYGITKKDNKFHIPLKVLKERIKTLTIKKEGLEQTMNIIKQIVNHK